MSYVDQIAARIKASVPADLLPDDDTTRLFRLYAVLALAKGAATEAADVHNAWVVWMLELDAEHRSIRPFEELDAETQSADAPYVEAIRAVATDHG
jgi:hypothetical protein